MRSLERDPSLEIVEVKPERCHKRFRLFTNRSDKAWGLVDCISFVVMRERDLRVALTADAHFRQAGFQALLLDPVP